MPECFSSDSATRMKRENQKNAVVERAEDLREGLADDLVGEVVEEVVLVRVARERVARKVVIRVDTVPQEWHRV